MTIIFFPLTIEHKQCTLWHIWIDVDQNVSSSALFFMRTFKTFSCTFVLKAILKHDKLHEFLDFSGMFSPFQMTSWRAHPSPRTKANPRLYLHSHLTLIYLLYPSTNLFILLLRMLFPPFFQTKLPFFLLLIFTCVSYYSSSFLQRSRQAPRVV